MGASAAELRRDIARTRGEMSETIEALETRLAETKESVVDRVSPKRVWHRKTAGVRGRLDDMGTSISELTGRTGDQMAQGSSRVRGQVQETAGGTAGALGEQARNAGPAVKQRAESNPMAAGLVALGAGFLVAALLPPSERERQAAQRVQSQLEPFKQQATEVGKQMAGELQQVAQQGLEEVKGQATSAVEQVKQETSSSAEQVKEEAQSATTTLKRQARSASRQVKETSTGEEAPTRPRRAPRRAPARARSSR